MEEEGKGPGADPAPLEGRSAETALLERALHDAQEGRGSAWVVQGPAGMGKTRLLRWFEHRGQELGFTPVWAYALQDIPSPYFLLDQVFARLPRSMGAGGSTAPAVRKEALPPVLLVRGERPDTLYARLEAIPPTSRLLLVSRDMPSRVTSKHPALPRSTRHLWLTRSEGAGNLAPGDLDRLGEVVTNHLQETPGGVVALGGVDYLASQNGFPQVLKLLQYVRDVAESTEGHLVLGYAPATLEPRERALLEAEGEGEGTATTAPPSGEPVGPPPDEPASARLLRYASTLEGRSRDRPVLVLLDDLQWADPQSLTAYRFLVKGIGAQRVILAATLREEGPQAVPAELSCSLDSLAASGALLRLSLGPLDRPGSARLARTLLPGPLRSTDAAEWVRLLDRAGGNPYFILETVRYLLRDNYLRPGPDGLALDPRARELLLVEETVGGPTGVPPALSRLIRSRLAPLPSKDLELTEAAAIAGSHFPESALAGALHRPLEEVQRSLMELDRVHTLLEPEGDAPGTWAFKHPYVWEVVREATPTERTAPLALVLARWWAEYRGDQVDQVARLFHQAGKSDEGLPWIRRAGDRAERLHAGAALERYSRWALELLGNDPASLPQRWAERRRLANALIMDGEGPRGLQELETLAKEELPDAIRFDVELDICSNLHDVDRARAEARLEALLARWPKAPGALPTSVELHRCAVVADGRMLARRSAEAREAAQEGLALAAPHADPELVCRLYDSLGWASIQLQDLAAAREAFSQGRRVAESADLQALLAYHLDGLGSVALREERLPQALELFRMAAEVSRRAGDLLNSLIHSIEVVSLQYVLEGLEAVRPALEEDLRLLERLDISTLEDQARASLGDLALAGGDLTLARRCLISSTSAPALEPHAGPLERRLMTAQLLAAEGHGTESSELLLSTAELARKVQRPGVAVSWHLALAWSHLAQGERTEARSALGTSLPPIDELSTLPSRLIAWDLAQGLAKALEAEPEAAHVRERIASERTRVGLPPVRETPSLQGKT